MDEHYCSLGYIENSTYTFCHTAIPIFSIVSSIAGWVITLFFFCNVVMWCITVLNSVITLHLQLSVICGSAVICVMGWWKNACEKCLFFQHLLQTACVHRGSTTFETCDMDIPSFCLFDGKVQTVLRAETTANRTSTLFKHLRRQDANAKLAVKYSAAGNK